tara:strand:- start:9614 stop:10243 length:630 start_codon:yes stop_codon:yes gene_type:complete
MLNKENKFYELAIESNSLLLGDFILKSGKRSPYFFNVGSFFESGYIGHLANLYTDFILENDLDFEIIFGPAYKGIPLAASIASSLSSRKDSPVPFAFDRKEEKSHGEGGKIVGNLQNKKVLIVDDVLTAGTALMQSAEIIIKQGGIISDALVALDREEKIDGILAKEKIRKEINIDVHSIAKISQLVEFFDSNEQQNEANVIKRYLKDQ